MLSKQWTVKDFQKEVEYLKMNPITNIQSSPITQAVNALIEARMAERGISRADMARELGISPVVVTQALNNKERDWKISTLEDWADALNCDLHIEFRARRDESEPR